MNWSALAAVISLLTLLGTVGIGVFVGGRMTQKIETTETDLRDLRDGNNRRLDGLDVRVGEHDVSLGRLHEWKDGFNAGSRHVPDLRD